MPDITAVSYPKSIPPMAEATERKMMYPVLVPACPDDVMMLFNFIFNGNKIMKIHIKIILISIVR